VEGKKKTGTTGPVMFVSLRPNVIFVLFSRRFDWDEGNGFGCRGGWRHWAKLPPSKYVKKSL